jgi:hypothetical protein
MGLWRGRERRRERERGSSRLYIVCFKALFSIIDK